jgi:ATP-dependent Zn protease
MVGMYGMGKRYSQVSVKHDEDVTRAVMTSRGDEVEEIMKELHDATIEFIKDNRKAIEAVRDGLVEKSEFIGDDAEALLVAATGREA